MQQPQWADASTPSGMSGQMNTGSNASDHENALFQPYSTLDEPVKETILRDVRAVVAKLKIVMLPLDRTVSLIIYSAYIFRRVPAGYLWRCRHA